MNVLLSEPSVVLVVCDADNRFDSVRSALSSDHAPAVERVEHVETVDGALDRLEGTTDVGCVVVCDDLQTTDLAGACESLRSADADLPVVALAADGDETVAQAVTAAGATGYLTTAATAETIGSVVDDAITRYDERRTNAEESSILSTMLDEFGVSMYAKDDEGRHLRAAKVPGGYSPERLRGRTDVEVYGEDDETVVAGYIDDLDVMESEEPVYYRLEHYEKPSGDMWFRTTKVPWYDEDGNVKGLVGLSWDVTDYEHQRQRLERHQERMDQFAQYVSHDIRSPLQVANGALDIAREDCENEALEKVDTALDRIENIIADLTEVANEGKAAETFVVDQNDDAPIVEGNNLRSIVENVWEIVRTDGASLDVDVDERTIINAPDSSVRPILENLLKNAIVHGGTDVSIRVGVLDDGGFFVEDDGPGIPPEMRDRVFELGFTTAESGTGTGLNLVAELVDRHDWEKAVTTGTDGGARFEIRNCLLVPDPQLRVDPREPLELEDNVDVGDVEVPGSASYDEVLDRWTVEGAGSNIWRMDNDFHFVYTPVEGPVRLEGRIVDLGKRSDYSKAGVMVRNDLDDDAAYGYVGITPKHGTELLWRSERGEPGVSQHLEEEWLAYPWYRIERVGTTVTTSMSADHEEWITIDQRQVELDDEVYVGLVVCSFTPRRLTEATFENVSVYSAVAE